MEADRIEREVTIAAPVQRVWAAITEPQHVGTWFGQGPPARIDLRPGGIMHIDHGEHGAYPVRIEKVDPPHYFAYRWASGYPGQEATGDNSTLVEFTLTPAGEGTTLRLVESGFATLVIPAGRRDDAGYDSHVQGWAGKIAELAQYAENLTA